MDTEALLDNHYTTKCSFDYGKKSKYIIFIYVTASNRTKPNVEHNNKKSIYTIIFHAFDFIFAFDVDIILMMILFIARLFRASPYTSTNSR